MIKIELVSTWGIACGIAEHSAMLCQALGVEDDIDIRPNSAALDPRQSDPTLVDIVHLNYHAALHSRWDVAEVAALQEHNVKVVVTYHDTMSGRAEQPNSDRCKALAKQADAFIVHEPVHDIPQATYWRQGIPEPEVPKRWVSSRPIVGTCGFDFPWKNYELLARSSFEAGWAVLFAGGNISLERRHVLEDCNPHALFMEGFVGRRDVVAALAGCDATAFLYLCANTGTSAAIRLGIAARRPMLATNPKACRQFRDLEGESTGIKWLDDLSPPTMTAQFGWLMPEGHSYQMHCLAEQDSWHRLGAKHAQLYRDLAEVQP